MMRCLLTSSFQALVVGELWKEEKWVYSILLVCQLATFVQDTVAMAPASSSEVAGVGVVAATRPWSSQPS